MKTKLIPFREQPPQEAEVLYVMWHTGKGQMPAKHHYNMPRTPDSVWAWVPDRRMRRKATAKSYRAVHEKWGGHYYRPPRGGKATPVRIFGGKVWKWYWLYKEKP